MLRRDEVDRDILRRGTAAVQQRGGTAVQRCAGRAVQVGQDGGARRGMPETAGAQHTGVLKGVEDAGGNRAGHRRVGAGRTGASRIGAGRVGAGRTGTGRTGAGRAGAGRVGVEQPWEQVRRTGLLQHRKPPGHPQQWLAAAAQAGQHRLAERLTGGRSGRLPRRHPRRGGGGRQILEQRPQQERVAAGELPPARRSRTRGGGTQPRGEHLGHPAHRQRADPQPVAPRLAQQVGLPGVAQPVPGRVRQLGGDQQHPLGAQPPAQVDQPAQRGRVDEVGVVDGEHHRGALGERLQRGPQVLQQVGGRVVGGGGVPGRAVGQAGWHGKGRVGQQAACGGAGGLSGLGGRAGAVRRAGP